ncbi:MAG: STAS domain-containing protein [Acidimicrobiales bacterium]
MFKITLESIDGRLVCQPEGDLDAAHAASLRASFGALAQPTAVVIDLTGVPFLDSAGLGALVGGVRRIREAGGSVTVCAGRRSIARVLRTVGFDRVVTLVDTLGEALAVPFEDGRVVLAAGAG